MKAIILVNLCAREYNDVAFERIAKNAATAVAGRADWATWLNDAQRAVCAVRPDANSVTQALQLAAGTRQVLPSGGLKLLDITRNMGAAGVTIGKAIRGPFPREALDEADPDWHTQLAVGADGVRQWSYDDKKDPLTFWVDPPVQATGLGNVYVEAIIAKTPTDVVDADIDTANISLADSFQNALQSWMLYRAYSMATQAVGQFQRAQSYFGAFFQILGVKMKADMWLTGYGQGAMPSPQQQGARQGG